MFQWNYILRKIKGATNYKGKSEAEIVRLFGINLTRPANSIVLISSLHM